MGRRLEYQWSPKRSGKSKGQDRGYLWPKEKKRELFLLWNVLSFCELLRNIYDGTLFSSLNPAKIFDSIPDNESHQVVTAVGQITRAVINT